LSQESQFVELVRRIRAGDQDAVIALHGIFAGEMRYLIARQLRSDEIEDRLHDSFILVLEAIRRGELREPARLTGFVLTIVRRQVAAQIRSIIDKRHETTSKLAQQRAQIRRCSSIASVSRPLDVFIAKRSSASSAGWCRSPSGPTIGCALHAPVSSTALALPLTSP
jgi:hypothetical protein